MGMCFSVVCDDCKIIRDLDKFGQLNDRPEDRKEALRIAKEKGAFNAFRAELLVSFMGEHRGHCCRVFDDVLGLDELVLRSDYVKENFWTPYPGEKPPKPFHKKKPWWRFW